MTQVLPLEFLKLYGTPLRNYINAADDSSDLKLTYGIDVANDVNKRMFFAGIVVYAGLINKFHVLVIFNYK